MKRKSELIPPNFDNLPYDLKRKTEEAVYRIQLKTSHGFKPGDPCLTSSDKIEKEE